MIGVLVPVLASAMMPSTSRLGVPEGACRPSERGPAVIITVVGLKDRSGTLRAELYPARDGDFLGDDNVLLAAGKVFRRAVVATPASGDVRLCLRAPHPGNYSLAVVHSRGGARGFSLLHDGIGFASNPRLGHSKPSAAAGRIVIGDGLTSATIVMNYRRGLFSFSPLAAR